MFRKRERDHPLETFMSWPGALSIQNVLLGMVLSVPSTDFFSDTHLAQGPIPSLFNILSTN